MRKSSPEDVDLLLKILADRDLLDAEIDKKRAELHQLVRKRLSLSNERLSEKLEIPKRRIGYYVDLANRGATHYRKRREKAN